MSIPELEPLDQAAEPIVIHVPPFDDAAPAAGVAIVPDTPSTPKRGPKRKRKRGPTPSAPPASLPALATVPLALPKTSTADAPAPTVDVEPKRASSLDALRGLFLVSMTFGFTIASDHLPLWMYHRQFPPSAGDVPANVAGISWRDLTYVSFLFTMATALPLTLSRRIDRGEPELGIVFAAVKRYWMLFVYGLLLAHANTYFIGYTQTGRVLSLVGFGIMALVFTRRRKDWDAERFAVARRVGWGALVLFLALSPLAYGKTFTIGRMDDVIADLAFASCVGSLLWYFTRERTELRLAALAGVVALYFGAHGDGWIQSWWYASPFPSVFTPSQLDLLVVVIPGTIAGDLVRRWMNAPEEPGSAAAAWTPARLRAIAVLSAIITPIFTVGMYTRAVQGTTEVVLALLAVGIGLTWKPRTSLDRLVRSVFLWGALWLTIGLFLEPAEGGIRKVPETLSYFFSVTGTTSLLLVTMTVVIEGLRKRRWVHALIDVGQNPLLGYVVFTLLLNPLLELVPPFRGVLQSSPGLSIVRSLIEAGLVVLAVRYVTHKRVFWRT